MEIPVVDMRQMRRTYAAYYAGYGGLIGALHHQGRLRGGHMNEQFRSPQSVNMVPGKPNVPEPHPADYSSEIRKEVFALIDELCDQNPTGGGTIKRFE